MNKKLMVWIITTAIAWIIIYFAGGGISFILKSLGVLYLYTWAIWFLVIISYRAKGSPSKYHRQQTLILTLSSMIMVPFIIIPPWEFSQFSGPIPRDGYAAWIGIIIFAIGVFIQFLSMRALQSGFGARLSVKRSQPLITSIPYNIIRHPGYFSHILAMLGASLAMSSILGILMIFLLIPLLVIRINDEEAMLLKVFGRKYSNYQKKTKWRMLPFVY
ncbi:MAG: isoprenylcysteine carboxylmethyltransferase family protein [Candidatus Margulisbacteria bacterium]|nr:isoprenylcysteine carboxylmethyltransferase family protein [Candidatus Margulisiibacteriota bacterium]MBU1022254.1 isoprenylcysteine carboxylmethyltransferase family protein [Candidatus Margulisiibacteriota bacterium]MBU1729307.1 isoprenylcysteine carboxylmethyltransferase family protein [Candidatus Margulisiibacteriota bacterium]MBU1955580.1 isoprenylcysteine carboxylmethyltransferase family protein [Candidatus Margulisiibacteriota bacterium]